MHSRYLSCLSTAQPIHHFQFLGQQTARNMNGVLFLLSREDF